MTALIIFFILSVLLITGMPVSIALGLTVFTFLFGFTSIPMDSIALKLFTGIEKFEIMAIPFFILAGNFLTHGGVARRMIRFATSMVGHWYGGMGLAAVLSCAMFAAISGSSPATVMAVGSIMIPAMVQMGYPAKFGVATVATAGGLGILIPPSIVMVMYSVATSGMMVTGPDGAQVMAPSIGEMFIAGVVPGLLLAAMFGVTTVWRAWRNGYPRLDRASWRDRWKAFRESVWGLMLIAIIMGGIYGGLFTPTEAAAVSAVYAFFIAVFVYKDIRLRDVPRVLLNSAAMSAMLLYIITNAVMFAFILTSEQIPQALSAWIVDLGLGWVGFLLVVNVMLLVIGMVMEPSAIVLIMAPILFPVAAKLGIDPVHFGIMMVVNMEIGLCTPPVGLNLYVGSAISRLGLTQVSVAVVPWLLTALIFLALITYIPAITLLLPNLLGF
ncbi:TRAP transporter large permease [Paracoccus denitrificans]|jgi:C4-dicarboxylate transporter DctM subunit|uniref:TRAP transporter large permease protein n=1 Tax=Paracoccus denitrificans (strain Pd 1222) TaxID=318586 RepID=A1B9J0_PARDP|nr:TRAP transporter large permease subunit [Paracoccus denitrificans]ABL72184.1 TRAP dicarboxylate transporter, DctM subunit [Paracoccus denitrificans PD1222]MBB4625897.1 C4-dicarboxylate transporter DctM subunit [Paracoccus denitrificans]MCU7426939.1 TRAP transporter large permease subunit [Paracoccus denitrificans]QAR28758.1 TRAP transporter large permease subunit [Paracoccus denitrificans]UPV96906.1 TRAP transporter large permease subunit [Paracoccus denitrificans]